MPVVVTGLSAALIGLMAAGGMAVILGFLGTCLVGIAVGVFDVVHARQENALRVRLAPRLHAG